MFPAKFLSSLKIIDRTKLLELRFKIKYFKEIYIFKIFIILNNVNIFFSSDKTLVQENNTAHFMIFYMKHRKLIFLGKSKITIYNTVISTEAGDEVVEPEFLFGEVSRLFVGLFDPSVARFK